ncbi:hypothetical protein CK203_050145 [Vitis vinifera]|uniref:SWIM-type domain-containing protein n=1 Tax=Vitis vinifera TaxID=29760 RepID=A0A438GYN1_VITVI|nr:hypothetical protein CK203_050145 [Vitis vinifera]
MVRTQTDVDYVGDRVVVEPIDVPLGTTYEQLLEMIYSVTDINKEHFRLILSYLGWMKLSYLLNKSEEDEEDEEGTQCDDDSVGAEDVHNDDNQDREGSSPFLAVREAIEREQMRYVAVDGEGCNLSNNPDTEDLDDPIELSPMQYHLAPSPQFENVENIGHVVSSEWTPWGNTLMGHPTGEFIVGQIFNSKGDLQHAVKIGCIQASVVERFGYHISYTKASKGKRKALTNLFGNMRNEEVFQRVFWAFHPSIEGFKHCRPVLTIDGTHLYGKYKGTKSSNSNEGLCVIFDHHPGIMAAFADVYLGWSEPNAYHRICMRHLTSNFMTHFKDKCLKQLLCRAALETKVEKFNMHMETIGRINQDALSWLEAIPFEKWALSHDGGRRYGIMTTNMSEVFNSVLKGARSFPITAFVQLTFYRVNSYFAVRREHGASRLASGEQYTPYVDAKINANVVKAGSHEVVLYDHFQGLFHVKASRGSKKTSSGGRTHRVNLREHVCTCGKTLIYGFPCSLILAACHFRSIDFRSFVQHYYTIQSYFSTWAPLFNPIHNDYEWPPYVGPVIVPADSMKRVSGGRPKSTCLHNEMDVREGKTSVTCGLCKQSGHNRRSCPNKNMGAGPS